WGTGLALAGDEVADTLLEPAALLRDVHLVLLGEGVVHRRLPAHFEREAIAVLGRLERGRILAGDLLRERHGLALQICKRHGEIDEANARRFLAVERPAGHAVKQRVARPEQ